MKNAKDPNNNRFDLSDKTLKEKLRNCKDENELQELMKEAGDMELSDDELDRVSGGIGIDLSPFQNAKKIRIDSRLFQFNP